MTKEEIFKQFIKIQVESCQSKYELLNKTITPNERQRIGEIEKEIASLNAQIGIDSIPFEVQIIKLHIRRLLMKVMRINDIYYQLIAP